MVMRPKSSATVVVRLSSTPLRSSVRVLIALIISSVRSGWISLTEVTIVVLPTPKPPAMSTLTAEVPSPGPPASEPPNAIEHRLQEIHVRHIRLVGRHWRAKQEIPSLDQVTDKDLHGG